MNNLYAEAPPASPTSALTQEWPAPRPLHHVPELPYPVDALPAGIKNAVMEVQSFVQAPIALVASAALTTLSLAGQSKVDVRRAPGLEGPTSLNFLVIAESGERKSTCEKFFTDAIRDYEIEQDEKTQAARLQYKSEHDAWEAKRGGLLDKLRDATRKAQDTTSIEAQLRQHDEKRPTAPRTPQLLTTDTTPEALIHDLMNIWPSRGIVTSEGGLVLGSHGMGKESAVRNLSLYNVLWDGGEVRVSRRKEGGNIAVRDARLTCSLQVQEATLRAFMEQTGELARGTGFLARCLIAQPPSTQGKRIFRDPPTSWPALNAFKTRIKQLLDQPQALTEAGGLMPSMVQLTPKAKEYWVAFFNAIEHGLGDDGDWEAVRDVASKAADNAARLAALFQLFQGGGDVDTSAIKAGCAVALWHLDEARRLLAATTNPTMADAIKLMAWLSGRAALTGSREIPRRDVQREGPSKLRVGSRLDAALRELEQAGHVRLQVKRIELHPSLTQAQRHQE